MLLSVASTYQLSCYLKHNRHAHSQFQPSLITMVAHPTTISTAAPRKLTNAQNTTFNRALKQSTTIRKDLSNLSSQSLATAGSTDSPNTSILSPAALGSLSASLTAFQRTIDEYNSLAKQELNPAKQDKAHERIRNFRTELAEYRKEFDSFKTQRDEVLHSQNRTELLGRRPYVTATPENPYANTSAASASSSPFARSGGADGAGSSGYAMGSGDVTREQHALREQNFFNSTNSALDEYIARGQAVLGDLGEQREMLKNTQKK